MEVEDEAGTFGELGIDVEVTVHLQGHLFADGEPEACCQSGCEDTESDDESPTCGQRTVFIGDGGFVVGNLFFQGVDLVSMLQGTGGVFPGDTLVMGTGTWVRK